MQATALSLGGGSAIVTGPTSRIAARQTRVLVCGTTNVVDKRKKSPPFVTVSGVVVVNVPDWSLIRSVSRAVSVEATE